MKKTLILFLIAVMILTALPGCSLLTAARSLERLDDAADAVEDSLEMAIEDALLPDTPALPASAPPAETAAPAETPPKQELTAQEAESIALEHAGLTADQVQYLRSAYDRDDGRPEYDVSFRQDRWEYEYEIHAETGEILSWDKDVDD